MRIIAFKKSRIKFVLISSLVVLLMISLALTIYNSYSNAMDLMMGGQYFKQVVDIEVSSMTIKKTSDEKYFRPSKLPILNNKRFTTNFLWDFHDKKPSEIVLPENLLKSPEDTIINYFSILQHAENLTSEKSGGCGTVGNAKMPFPTAYAFFTPAYQKKVSFKQYLESFEGIGHTNLIKMRKVPGDQNHPDMMRYFIEIETIEGSSKAVTYFAYYYGFMYLSPEGNQYKIADLQLYGEDFLCAPYHGWAHDAEASVDIRYGDWCSLVKERYPTQQDGYVKKIHFKGTDGKDYLIEFLQLTNDTDIEVAQYIKNTSGKWELIKLDPIKCLEERKK